MGYPELELTFSDIGERLSDNRSRLRFRPLLYLKDQTILHKMSYEDKENVYNEPSRQRRFVDRDGNSLCKSSEKAESKRGFSRLLKDVTNSIRFDLDEKVAEKVQDDDATSIINEWMSEQRDSRLAAKIAKEMEDDLKDQRRTELSQGEAAAMRVALEERKRIQLALQNRRDIEEKDAAMAKETHREEEAFYSVCAKDDQYAQELHDEQYAEREQEHENRLASLQRKQEQDDSAADEKIAKEHQFLLDKEDSSRAALQEEVDYQIALKIGKEEETDLSDFEKHKIQQVKSDRDMSRRLETATMRAEHRKNRRVDMMREFRNLSVQDLWMRADSVVEDVMDGICVTLLLPDIVNLNVHLKKKVVTVEAVRQLQPDEPNITANSVFDIDFEIEGKPILLTQDDVSYEYSSECGMLHIYIEKVHLEVEVEVPEISKDRASSPLTVKKIKSKISKIFFGVK